VNAWAELTLEQYSVMICAYEESYLNEVMDEYGARLQRAKTGDVQSSSRLDDEAKLRLIPHFADVVKGMIDRNLVEVREARFGDWDTAELFALDQLQDVLLDPASWVKQADGTHRMIMLMRTESWDRLAEQSSQIENSDRA
jgi:hypothetical protein